MIRRLVDFALANTFLILAAGGLLLVWGLVSFHRLPVKAYPDVADTWVQVITQWPGHAAEEIEQQVTVPLEVQVNGVAHMTHLRSLSLFGLSVVTLVFDDEANGPLNRAQVLERLAQVTLPAGVTPQLAADYSPVGQVYFYTLTSTNPAYDRMELKALQDWFLEKQFRSVPNVADVVGFGGLTREYQVQVDPDRLVSYGLTIGQVEQAISQNNTNAGGSFIEHGEQAFNVRAVGLMRTTENVGATVVKSQGGTPVRVRDVAVVTQGPKVRLGKVGRATRREDGTIIDDDDVVEGIVLLRKGAPADETLRAVHAKVAQLNGGLLPPGVQIVPYLDRSDLVQHTTHTVLHNLAEGMLLVTIVLFVFLGNVRSALIVAATIPFSLLFASILLDLRQIPANLLSLGALDFGMLVDGSVVMVENLLRRVSSRGDATLTETIAEAAHEVQRPVFFAVIIIIITAEYLPIFTLQRVEGRLFAPMAWTVAFALLGALLFALVIVGGLLTNLAISVFLLPTLYAVLAGPGDIAARELPPARRPPPRCDAWRAERHISDGRVAVAGRRSVHPIFNPVFRGLSRNTPSRQHNRNIPETLHQPWRALLKLRATEPTFHLCLARATEALGTGEGRSGSSVHSGCCGGRPTWRRQDRSRLGECCSPSPLRPSLASAGRSGALGPPTSRCRAPERRSRRRSTSAGSPSTTRRTPRCRSTIRRSAAAPASSSSRKAWSTSAPATRP